MESQSQACALLISFTSIGATIEKQHPELFDLTQCNPAWGWRCWVARPNKGSRFLFRWLIKPLFVLGLYSAACPLPAMEWECNVLITFLFMQGETPPGLWHEGTLVETSALVLFLQDVPLFSKPGGPQAEWTVKMAAVKSSVFVRCWVNTPIMALPEMKRLNSHLVGYLLYKWILSLGNNLKQKVWVKVLFRARENICW